MIWDLEPRAARKTSLQKARAAAQNRHRSLMFRSNSLLWRRPPVIPNYGIAVLSIAAISVRRKVFLYPSQQLRDT
jgi:hypothetical protein